jgi:hypothetical protein
MSILGGMLRMFLELVALATFLGGTILIMKVLL